jgi:hypothetical protein
LLCTSPGEHRRLHGGRASCLGRSSLSQTIEPEAAALDAAKNQIQDRGDNGKAAVCTRPPRNGLAMKTTKSVTPTANVEPAAAKVEPVPNKIEPAAVKVEPLASGRPAETSD